MSSFFENITGKIVEKLGGSFVGEKIINYLQNNLSSSMVQTLLDQAENVGLADKVRSWIGNHENLPISAEEVKQLLSNEQLQQFFEKVGIPANVLYPTLARFLPDAVSKFTDKNSSEPSKEEEPGQNQ